MLAWHDSVKPPSSGDSELERAKNPRCDNFFSIFSIINNDLRDTDISRYFAVTEFNNFFIIRSQYLREAKRSAIFTHDQSDRNRRRRKVWFHLRDLRLSRMLFAVKHSWPTLRMSRQLFVSSYLQVKWSAFGQWRIFLISVYQINEQQFSRVLVGSHNSEYP